MQPLEKRCVTQLVLFLLVETNVRCVSLLFKTSKRRSQTMGGPSERSLSTAKRSQTNAEMYLSCSATKQPPVLVNSFHDMNKSSKLRHALPSTAGMRRCARCARDAILYVSARSRAGLDLHTQPQIYATIFPAPASDASGGRSS